MLKKETEECDECSCNFFIESSKMKNLCPECSHHIHGYKNCTHLFIDGKCKKCNWDGNYSAFVRAIKLKNKKN